MLAGFSAILKQLLAKANKTGDLPEEGKKELADMLAEARHLSKTFIEGARLTKDFPQ